MEPFILFFAAFLVVVVIAGAVLMYIDIRHSQAARVLRLEAELKDRAMERKRRYNRLLPDQNGNYEVYYDGDNWFAPSPGNQPYPAQLVVMPPSSSAAPPRVTELMRPLKPRDIQVFAYNAKKVDGTVDSEEPEELPAGPKIPEISAPSENRNFSKVEPEKAENFDNFNFNTPFQAELIQAKKAGEGKTEAIQRITGARPGGSKAWNFYRDLWDNL